MTAPTGPEVADALAAEGSTITLVDGDGVETHAKVRYSLDSLRTLEHHFGDLEKLQESFGKILANIGKPGSGQVIDPLVTFLAAGLRHVRYVIPDTGEVVRLGRHPDLVAELMDVSNLQGYASKFAAAFGQAMGPTTQASATPALSQRSTGPGASGGISPSTLGTFVQPTSGT